MGHGDGTFGTKVDYGVGNGPISVAVGDLNHDNQQDLAVANYTSNTVSILLNTGAGSADVDAGADPVIALLFAPTPNPARSVSTITFSSPSTEVVTLEIRDIAGRLTQVLSSGVKYSAGRHTVTWDGKDEAGRPVASGIYLAHLRAGDRRSVQKIAMLR
jgi:flagellar hook assembly protein FlgD